MVTITLNDVPIIGLHVSFGSSTTIPRPYKWHWLKDGVPIAGAPSACAYMTPPLRSSDFGAKYSVRIFGLDGEIETSDEVKLNTKPLEHAVVKADVVPEGDLT